MLELYASHWFRRADSRSDGPQGHISLQTVADIGNLNNVHGKKILSDTGHSRIYLKIYSSRLDESQGVQKGLKVWDYKQLVFFSLRFSKTKEYLI